jgi:Zn-dependent membrane protease YugP
MSLFKKTHVLIVALVFVCPLFAQKTVQTTYTSGVNSRVTTTTGAWDLEIWADSRGTGGCGWTCLTTAA